jgi:DNA mismatch repair protein MSH2
MSQDSGFGLFDLQLHDLAQYMRLDASAVKALCLMPSLVEGANRNMSLYGLLNKCRTPQGSRLLLQWIKQPLIDLQSIHYRQNFVQIFYDNSELRQALQVFPY